MLNDIDFSQKLIQVSTGMLYEWDAERKSEFIEKIFQSQNFNLISSYTEYDFDDGRLYTWFLKTQEA